MTTTSQPNYNAREAAEILNVHPEAIRKKIRAGKVRAVRDGKSYIIPADEVERLLNERETPERAKHRLQTVHSLLADERERIGEQLDHSTGRAFLTLTERYKALGIAMQEVMHLMDQSSQDAQGDGEPPYRHGGPHTR